MHADIEDYINILFSFSIDFSGDNIEQLRNKVLKCKDEFDNRYILGEGGVICGWSDEVTPVIEKQCFNLQKKRKMDR